MNYSKSYDINNIPKLKLNNVIEEETNRTEEDNNDSREDQKSKERKQKMDGSVEIPEINIIRQNSDS